MIGRSSRHGPPAPCPASEWTRPRWPPERALVDVTEGDVEASPFAHDASVPPGEVRDNAPSRNAPTPTGVERCATSEIGPAPGNKANRMRQDGTSLARCQAKGRVQPSFATITWQSLRAWPSSVLAPLGVAFTSNAQRLKASSGRALSMLTKN